MSVRCGDLRVVYGDVRALDGVDLAVAPGSVVALLGPSGSGKSTLLAAVGGFVRVDDGWVELDGRRVSSRDVHVPPEQRRVGVVFQSDALWPHLSAVDTVAYPLRRRGVRRAAARAQALELLEAMGIAPLAQRRPAELSGGQRQRVGIARALANAPTAFLFDEPTAHLDTPLRAALQAEILERQRAAGASALYATHDAGEALAMADEVVLLADGRVLQRGTPAVVYERPVSARAAALTGPVSALHAAVELVGEERALVAVGTERIEVAAAGRPGGAVLVRPEWAHVGGALRGRVLVAAYRGAVAELHLDTPAGRVIVRADPAHAARPGDVVPWGLERVCLGADDGDRILAT